MSVKIIYGKEYWLERLIEFGKINEPAKYTNSVIERIRKYWQNKSLTDLHITIVKRIKGEL